MKHTIYIGLITFILICCNTNKKETQQHDEKRSQFLVDFVNNTDTVLDYQYDDRIFHFEELLHDHKDSHLKGFIYVLNSECSICIGEFLDFIFHVKELKNLIRILVITEPGSKELLDYYLDQTGMNHVLELSVYENNQNKYIEGPLEKQNGNVFYLFKDRIINKFSYDLLIDLD